MPATIELLQEGRYRISQESAQSEDSSIFEAYDTVRETEVVVKEIPANVHRVMTASQQELRKVAFANQAKMLTEINHESLLHVHDYFSEVGRQYLVMESVDGDELSVLLERNMNAFPLSDVLNWADQLLDAFTYLHTYKPTVIHRNVRPENIKLDSAGKVKLLALGLAEGPDADVTTALSSDPSGSQDISYSPLEQIWAGLDSASQKVITNSYDENSERTLKAPADARSDIYALGATLYHLLTACKPIDALERSIDILDGKSDPLKPANQIDPTVPPEISDLLMKAMEIKRENRFDSAVIMRQVLRTALVRAKERETEELHELENATQAVRLVEENEDEPARNSDEQKRLDMEAEQRRETELMKKQLREAEAQRLLAEQRAADAEKRLQEAADAALSASAVDIHLDGDEILEISEASDVVFEDNSEVLSDNVGSTDPQIEEPELVLGETDLIVETEADIQEQLVLDEKIEDEPEGEVETYQIAATETDSNKEIVLDEEIEDEPAVDFETFIAPETEEQEELALDDVVENESEGEEANEPKIVPVSDEIVGESPSPAKVSFTTPADFQFDRFEAPAAKGFPLPMPALAIGVIVVLFIAAGIWMFMPSTPSVTDQGGTGQASTAAEPASQTAEAPALTNPAESQFPAAGQVVNQVETAPGETNNATEAGSKAAVAKAKKPTPTPAKPTAQKKAVTADDLINDN